MNGITILENLTELGQIILFLWSYAFYWRLVKTKRERKLSLYERVLKFFVMFGLISWGYHIGRLYCGRKLKKGRAVPEGLALPFLLRVM
ncbi:hypothetical protein QF033_000233 [Bacillus pumilus]|uniref:hypothetical protein n=1 Tax=Bacillus pumilus TaxID=1408 RepID=UPI002783051E|nr:hypothetical protein [Bacillus pumilus]MDQ0815655.1 hypothetical protein [Bacillus pumilus]